MENFLEFILKIVKLLSGKILLQLLRRLVGDVASF
jgi:hypothetical protein